ncbi:hypothetical protein [Microcoleus sp. Pol17_C1]
MILRQHGDRMAGKVGRVWSGRTVTTAARLARVENAPFRAV